MVHFKVSRLIRIHTVSLFLALWFSACSQGSGNLPYDLEVTENGIGKINKTTPFDAAKVNALLPGFEANSYTAFKHGDPYPILRITRHEKEVMLIIPTKDKTRIASVAVVHADVKMPKGSRLGDPFDKIYSDSSSCRPADGELSGKVLCQVPDSSHLFYLFSGPQKSSQAIMPALGQLNRWTIDEIIWKP